MSSPWDWDEIMGMSDDDVTNVPPGPADPEEPAARFTHRVVPLHAPQGVDTVAFKSHLRDTVRLRLVELRDDLRRCAQLAGVDDLMITVSGREVSVVTGSDEEADEIRDHILEYTCHNPAPDPDLHGALHLREYISALSRDVVERARDEALRGFRSHDDPPAIARLSRGVRDHVRGLMRDAPMAGPQGDHEADVLAAELHASAPWLREATMHVWSSMRESIEAGRGPCIRPLLIYGPPGSGKTSLARALARAMPAPVAEIDVGAGASGFRIAGTERGWGSSGPGVPVQTVLDTGCPNPVIIINEICHAGGGMLTTGGNITSMVTSLLQLLDVDSASRFTCPALRVPFDMSRVSWILTANDLDRIPQTLLSRVRRIYAPMPGADDVADIVRRRLADLDAEMAEHAAGLVRGRWKEKRGRMTLRQVEALCERVRRAATGPLVH